MQKVQTHKNNSIYKKVATGNNPRLDLLPKLKAGILYFFMFCSLMTLTSCSMNFSIIEPWASEESKSNILFLLKGVFVTLELSIYSIFFAVILGFIFAIFRLSHNKILSSIGSIYVTIFRIIPLFVLLLWVYYALPISLQELPESVKDTPIMKFIFKSLTPLFASVLALSLNAGSFFTEIFRSGIQSVAKGQMEAGKTLGLSKFRIMIHIVLPQAFKNVVAPTISQFITIVKDTSMASMITLFELTRRVSQLQAQTFRPLELYTFLAVEYLVLLGTLSYIGRQVELSRYKISILLSSIFSLLILCCYNMSLTTMNSYAIQAIIAIFYVLIVMIILRYKPKLHLANFVYVGFIYNIIYLVINIIACGL